MKALLIGDVHLADRPPSIRNESYADEILAKLAFAVELANERRVDVVVQAGDMYHVKAPTRTSHRLVQQTIDVFSALDMPLLVVPGNHDMQYDRIDSLSKQPLGTLCKAPGIDLLMGWHDRLPIFGLPYLHDWVAELPKWMSEYRAGADARKAQDMDFMPLLVTHAPIFPVGQEPPYDFIAADDWAEQMLNGHCYYGHIHDPHGMYEVAQVTMCNYGALSRGSLHEATLKRKPMVTLYNGTFKPVEVPHLPAERAFRLAEKEDVDQRQERVTDFLDGVERTVLSTLTVEEVVEHARAMELKPRTLDEIQACIEHVMSEG